MEFSTKADIKVKDRLRDSNFKAEKGNEQVDSNSLVRLRPGQWLNDDVINFYLELIKTRSKDQGGNVSSMNTFFYQKLSKDGYQSVRRWTKRLKLDIFSLDKLLIPINIQNMHWVCAVINFSARRIEYYDSMSDSGHRLEVFQVSR